MAYTSDQTKGHIAEIQRYLYSISHHNARIPRIFPDGIYGPQTAAAVGAFQREYDLPVTGETDHDTWRKIVDIFFEFNNDIVLLDVFPENYEVLPGDEGEIISIVQVILNALSRRFENIPKVNLSGIFDRETQSALNHFKKIAGFENIRNVIDSDTWNRLASGFNMMEHKNNS